VATGQEHTTVAAQLRALPEEDDPLVDLIKHEPGLAGRWNRRVPASPLRQVRRGIITLHA